MGRAGQGQGHHRAMKNGTVLVTGGSRGIGRAIVARLIEDGYEAVNFSRGAPESLLPGETFRSVDLADARAAGEAARTGRVAPRAASGQQRRHDRGRRHRGRHAGRAGAHHGRQPRGARRAAAGAAAGHARGPPRTSGQHRQPRRAGQAWAHGLWRVQGRAGGHDADLGAGAGGRRHHGEHRGAGAGGDGTVQRVESPAIRARARWRPRSRWGAAVCRKKWRTWWPCSWTGAPPS